MATEVRPGPFAGENLNGLEVFWLAVCSLAGAQGDAEAAKHYLRVAQDGDVRRSLMPLEALHLEGANLREAGLERAFLRSAYLEGANLIGAHLEGANLREATLDANTNLAGAALDDTPARLLAPFMRFMLRRRWHGPVALCDVRWNGALVTAVDWSVLHQLGDGQATGWWWRSRKEAEAATRANVQVSRLLREAGLNDDADRFAYRAQVRQRGVHRLRLRLARWLFSWVLFVLAGYGYRPLRTVFWYLAAIAGFAFAYYQATHGLLTFGLAPSTIQPLQWYEALVLSVSSFHGRGFFQPVQSLGDPVAILASIEAVFGLFIEVSFIATFTQRVFGK